MSEKHTDFEIEPVNTIQPPEIKYMSCDSKMASFPVNYMSGLPSVLEGS